VVLNAWYFRSKKANEAIYSQAIEIMHSRQYNFSSSGNYFSDLPLDLPGFLLTGLCGLFEFLNHPLCFPLSCTTSTAQEVVLKKNAMHNARIAKVLIVFIFFFYMNSSGWITVLCSNFSD
jgi:hypothetical protein